MKYPLNWFRGKGLKTQSDSSLLGLPKFSGTKNLYELFLNDMIPFEIFKSVEICAYVHRFLFEIAK